MPLEIIEAPQLWKNAQNKPVIFLAGSIEMGKAVNWQAAVGNKFKDYDIILLNPRRVDWDNSWEQSVNNIKFSEQVNWELNGIEKSDRIIFYFQGGTKSPITLLELGLIADKNKAVVYCEIDFWRKGNVDIVCQKYGIKQVDSWENLYSDIKKHFNL
jgi:Nucleoside 2-deoxyribosyltransferase like